MSKALLETLITQKQFFILLDNAVDEAESYLFHSPVDCIAVYNFCDIESAFQSLEAYRKKGYYLSGYCSYELGYDWLDLQELHGFESKYPLLYFGVFEAPIRISHHEVEEVIRQEASKGLTALHNFQFSEDYCNYQEKIRAIHDLLERGELYQLNYSIRLNFELEGSISGLYHSLQSTQKTDYTAWLHWPEYSILSFSPEQFVSKKGNVIQVMPMKGTILRDENEEIDLQKKYFLSQDIKNRAENLMILDLLRNDLSKVSCTGTVKVKKLFEIHSYQTIHQMISVVESQVSEDLTFLDCMKALFPSGSITGAPKRRSMEYIAQLETEERSFYCGSIGYVTPENDFCLNVAIRTLSIDLESKGWVGVGGGIVFDSTPENEWKEIFAKMQFMFSLNRFFYCIETMYYDAKQKSIPLLQDHLKRLEETAAYFGFAFASLELMESLDRKLRPLRKDSKIRLKLFCKGNIEIEVLELALKKRGLTQEIDFVEISPERISRNNIFQYYKTSVRSLYDESFLFAQEKGCYDFIFLNESLEVVEGSRHNVMILTVEGSYLTPPLHVGALAGVMRGCILKEGYCGNPVKEATLYSKDLYEAQAIYLMNAVCGVVSVQLRGHEDREALGISCS